MSPESKQIILTDINEKLCSCTFNLSQDSAATELREGGSFNSSVICKTLLNLTLKNFEMWSKIAKTYKNSSGLLF